MYILKLLSILVAFTGFNKLHAQQPLFDAFVKEPTVEWAAYVGDTFRFKQPNLDSLLANRLAAGQIKASLAFSPGFGYMEYADKKSIDNLVLYPAHYFPFFDSLGNQLPVHIEPRRIDTPRFNLTGVYRILYIEKGKLKTYVPWASVMIEILTYGGQLLGNSEYFSSCFNIDRHQTIEQYPRALFLGRFYQSFSLDSVAKEYRLKEMYGSNMIETLWPSVVAGNYRLLSLPGNTEIKPGNQRLDTVVFTSGNDTSTALEEGYVTILPKIFVKSVIEEDWYYDEKTNQLFTKPRSLQLWARRQVNYQDTGEPVPVLNILLE